MRVSKSKVSTASRPAPLAVRLPPLSARAYGPKWETETVRLKPGNGSRKNSASIGVNVYATEDAHAKMPLSIMLQTAYLLT